MKLGLSVWQAVLRKKQETRKRNPDYSTCHNLLIKGPGMEWKLMETVTKTKTEQRTSPISTANTAGLKVTNNYRTSNSTFL